MEREVSSMTMIGVTLWAIAAVIGIVMVTVSIGNNIKSNAYNKIDSISNNVEVGALSEIRISGEVDISCAAAYNILINNEDVIGSLYYHTSEFSYSIYNAFNGIKAVKKKLSGRCKFSAGFNSKTSLYDVHVYIE